MKKRNLSGETQSIKTNNSLIKIRKLVSKLPGVRPLWRMIRPVYFATEGFRYNAGGLITNKNCDFMKDSKFIEGYTGAIRQHEQMERHIPIAPPWNYHITK